MPIEPDKQLARHYIRAHDDLGPLADRASALIEIRRIVRECLPDGLARACVVANFRQQTLVIDADNAAVAAKVRQLAQRLTARLLEKGWQISAITLRIQGRTIR